MKPLPTTAGGTYSWKDPKDAGQCNTTAKTCVLNAGTYSNGIGLASDGYTYTLEEVGRIFKVTRERVRQVEAKAIRKLQHPVRARKLEGFLPGGVGR